MEKNQVSGLAGLDVAHGDGSDPVIPGENCDNGWRQMQTVAKTVLEKTELVEQDRLALIPS